MNINDRMTAEQALKKLLEIIDKKVVDIEKSSRVKQLNNEPSPNEIGKLWSLGFVAGNIDKMLMDEDDKDHG